VKSTLVLVHFRELGVDHAIVMSLTTGAAGAAAAACSFS
jgi:hypothetical protein